MSRISVPCPHCSKNTQVDLQQDMSTQRCRKCGMRLSAINTGLEPKKRKRVIVDPFTGQTADGRDEWELADSRIREGNRPDGPGAPLGISVSSNTGWWIVTCLLGLAFAGAGLWVWRSISQAEANQKAAAASKSVLDEKGDLIVEKTESLYDKVKLYFPEAQKAAEAFLQCKDVDQLVEMIDDRAVWEDRVRNFYASPGGLRKLPHGFDSFAPVSAFKWFDGPQVVLAKFYKEDNPPRGIALKRTAEGRWLVDWPSLLAYGDVPINTFIESNDPEPRLLRVYAAHDSYFDGEFTEDTHSCLRFRDVDSVHTFYGYCQKDSRAGKLIKAMQLPQVNPRIDVQGSPLMVKVKRPNKPQAIGRPQVEIIEMVASGWILLPENKPDTAPGDPNSPSSGSPEAKDQKKP